MSRQVIGRRDLASLPLAFLLAPLARASADTVAHTAPYRVDVRLLYGALTYRIDETLAESIDRSAGRYEVAMTGEGDVIESHRVVGSASPGALGPSPLTVLLLREGA